MKKPTKKDIIYLAIIVVLVAALVTVSVLYGVCIAKQRAGEPSYYDKKCASFELQNANLSKGQIVFIGDSITDGYPLDNYFTDLPLATYNRGIGGDVTSGVIRRLKTSLYDLAPTKIALMIGINDINSGRTNDEIIANYTTILDGIKANLPSAAVYCESVLPMHSKVEKWGIDLEARTQQIKDLNARIKALAEEKGYTYIDLYTSFSDGSDRLIDAYTEDGLHPIAAGYQVWSAIIKPYLV